MPLIQYHYVAYSVHQMDYIPLSPEQAQSCILFHTCRTEVPARPHIEPMCGITEFYETKTLCYYTQQKRQNYYFSFGNETFYNTYQKVEIKAECSNIEKPGFDKILTIQNRGLLITSHSCQLHAEKRIIQPNRDLNIDYNYAPINITYIHQTVEIPTPQHPIHTWATLLNGDPNSGSIKQTTKSAINSLITGLIIAVVFVILVLILTNNWCRQKCLHCRQKYINHIPKWPRRNRPTFHISSPNITRTTSFEINPQPNMERSFPSFNSSDPDFRFRDHISQLPTDPQSQIHNQSSHVVSASL